MSKTKKLFVVSDVHGYLPPLREALGEAGFDRNDASHFFICCGDLFDLQNDNEALCSFVTGLERKILILGDREEALSQAPDLSDALKTLIRGMKNCCETEKYLFVHGWIPVITEKAPEWSPGSKRYSYNPNWRNAGKNDWFLARWQNGMDIAKRFGITEPGKTIVCGHYHVSWGHAKEGRGPEWGEGAVFEPYRADGILALDACTSHSGKVNCIVIED